ncbi:MAG: PBP1A family penicillin-binding protein [Pseudomonadota bacterium]
MAEKNSAPRKRSSKAGPRASAPRGTSYAGNPAYRAPKGGRRRSTSKRKGGGSGSTPFLKRRSVWKVIVRLMMAGFIVSGLIIMYFAATLPDIRALDTIKKQQGITVETIDGRVIANYGDVYGSYIPYDQLPKPLVQAVIATEDRRFFEHHGVDFFGIARAIVTNITRGQMVQGGSTVTQQVAKNVFLTPDRTFSRKMQEMLLAFWLEARFSKKEIMAIYLNRVYLGSGTFGVDAASRRYFNKSARDLNLFESALMAGLLKAPSRYSPTANAERARTRVHQVLLNMVDAGYLKEREIAPAMASLSKSPARETQGGDVRYFTDWIVDSIPDVVGQVDEDMIVTTTLDTQMQAQAQDALQNVIAMQGEKKNVTQGAIVSMKPDGAVQALIGGMSYAQSQYNRATQAKRQPGSSFKLFVYLAALEAGMTPQSMVEDAPISIQVGNRVWSPENFEVGGYRGQIPMVEAIRYSLNTVSVRLSQFTGVSKVAQMAMRLGVPNIPERPSIALGAVEATLLEMTSAYAHLPSGGKRVEPYGILSIRTRNKEIYKRPDAVESDSVLAKGTVEMMNYMLMDVVTRGTAVKAGLPGRQAAGKTGTSQDYKDAWFVGFTSQLVTGVWVGNDDNKSMKKITGGSIPATIWHDYMIKAMEGLPAKPIPSSAGSSEGLLPWLFGTSGDSAAPPAAATTNGTIPEDAPFGRAGSDQPAAEQAPAPMGVPSDPTAAPQAHAAPAETHAAKADDEVLTPQFWDKLMDKVPEKGKVPVEYTYPDGKRRH